MRGSRAPGGARPQPGLKRAATRSLNACLPRLRTGENCPSCPGRRRRRAHLGCQCPVRVTDPQGSTRRQPPNRPDAATQPRPDCHRRAGATRWSCRHLPYRRSARRRSATHWRRAPPAGEQRMHRVRPACQPGFETVLPPLPVGNDAPAAGLLAPEDPPLASELGVPASPPPRWQAARASRRARCVRGVVIRISFCAGDMALHRTVRGSAAGHPTNATAPSSGRLENHLAQPSRAELSAPAVGACRTRRPGDQVGSDETSASSRSASRTASSSRRRSRSRPASARAVAASARLRLRRGNRASRSRSMCRST